MKKSKEKDEDKNSKEQIRVSGRSTKGKPPVRFANSLMTPNLNFNSTPMPGHEHDAENNWEDEFTINENAIDDTIKPRTQEPANDNAIMQMILSKIEVMSLQFENNNARLENQIGRVADRVERNEKCTKDWIETVEAQKSEAHSSTNSIRASPTTPHTTNPFLTLSSTHDASWWENQTPMFPPTTTRQSNPFLSLTTQMPETRRKLHDLPTFSGSYEDWPMFISTFNETTTAYGYSNLENLMRLQRSLQGKAKESVEAMLVHPNSVPEIMEELLFRFGRPQLLVKSQIDKLRKISRLADDDCSQLIEFSTKVRNFVAFAQGANVVSHLNSPDLLETLIEKLPTARQIEWAYEWSRSGDQTSIASFSDWLSRIARIASLVESTSRSGKPNRKHTLYTTETEKEAPVRSIKCYYCKEPHVLDDCKEFEKMSVSQRWDWVKLNNLCFSCFASSHRAMDCRKRKRCDIMKCNRRHHYLLHEYQNEEASEETKPVLSVHEEDHEVLFKIIPVTVVGTNDVQVRTYAILDDAASMTFMESSLAEELDLDMKSTESVDLSWLDETTVRYQMPIADCRIRGTFSHAQTYVMKNVRLLENLSLPSQNLDMESLSKKYPQLKKLPLSGFEKAKPRILIGLNNASLGYVKDYVKCSSTGPIAIETPLGWLMYGTVESPTRSDGNNQILLIGQSLKLDYQRLHETVAQFYELENLGVHDVARTLEPKDVSRARNILQTTTRRINNHYESGLLWKEDEPSMPDSYHMANKRLIALEKKKRTDPLFASAYEKAMSDFITKNYARKLHAEEAKTRSKTTWYLPHFGVVNPNKPGRVRIVFDAAAQVANVSLNSALLKGPDLNQPLLAVIFQFREGRIAVCGDIREMFLQVKIRKEDQDSQRFLVMENGTPVEYVMQSMIFGAACSPTTAQYIKNMHAEKFREQYPDAVNAIQRNHYVDDYVKSYSNEHQAIGVTEQIVKIHDGAGFELRGFISNSTKVERVLNGHRHCQKTSINLDIESDYQTEKVLGMHWRNDLDELVFELKFHKVAKEVLDQKRNPTKREMLSLAMSMFDPLGIIANHQVYAKIMIQETFNLATGWDDAIPDDLCNRWYQWQSTLDQVADVRVPRCYFLNDPRKEHNLELHIFVDASESAYAAVAYWRVVAESVVQLCFVTGKTRVAPRKLLTIPRLELQAAVLGLRMHQTILKCHSIQPSKSYYWSDSKTVINWIHSGSDKYRPFVAHRVAEILEYSDASDWSWVPTELNPADDGTRAKFPVKYEPNSRWLRGPEFLLNDSNTWPLTPNVAECDSPGELKTRKILIVKERVDRILPEMTRFSQYNRLLRTMAWTFRAVHNWKQQKKADRVVGELTVNELQFAEEHLCRMSQEESFSREYNQLSNAEPLSFKSGLFQLNACLADDHLIRLNGRIDAASCVPFGTKKPIILPRNHRLTYLIVLHYHQHCKHQFDETVICMIRQKFWIPCVRVVLRSVKANCQHCKIKKARPEQPMMGQLPFDRLASHVRPFTYTGLDYFGPYEIVIGRSTVKRWVALFTCSSYRGVHLEIAHDLSTDACILCLRNFVNIRGVPKRIRSDNGTNFVGLKGELCNVTDFFDHDRIRSEMAPFGIEWVFNSPGDPSAGGSWERLVQSVKRALASSLEYRKLQDHTFRSFLLEAMNIVNSRPLTHVPVNPDDEEPLTPNHFLIGDMNSTQIPGECNVKLMCSRKQWRIAQQLKNHFYRRWVTEYLPTLVRRSKWFENVPPLEVGQTVVICDANEPRSKWPMGKITTVTKARDGQVRTATVKTPIGYLKRPANKLAVLDVEVNSPGDSREGECRELGKNCQTKRQTTAND